MYATVSDPEKVLIGLGSGVSVEKNAAESKAILSSRRAELEKLLVDGNNELNFAANELMKLQQEAQKYQ
jgi:prefoldin alpha subunit